MRKRGAGIKNLIVAGILAFSMVCTGCGQKNSKWTFHVGDMEIDMTRPFTDNLEAIIDADLYPVDLTRGKIYDDDGEYSDISLIKNNIKPEEVVLFRLDEDNGQKCMSFVISRKFGPFKEYESADGITKKTDKKELPDYYLNTGIYGGYYYATWEGEKNYCALIVDGKYIDLAGYAEERESKIAEDEIEELREFYDDIEPSVKRVVPQRLFIGEMEDNEYFINAYKSEKAVRNSVAITYAVMDVYEKFSDGDIENFGYIIYRYDKGKMTDCEYYIVTEE